MTDDKLSRLLAKRAAVDLQIRREQGRACKKRRKRDTRKKIHEGVTALYGMEHSEEYRRLHEQFRLRALTLSKDREVFGLAPSPELVSSREVK
jgi:hypothetical protein